MLTVFLCHAGGDAALAREIAGFLECGAGIHAYVEEARIGPGESIVSKAAEGLVADVILLMFSPASIPARWVRAEWEPAFRPSDENVHVAALQCGDVHFPLEIERHFDLRSPVEGMRLLKQWLIRLGTPGREVSLPPRPAGFKGRDRELDHLRRAIADEPGAVSLFAGPGAGKTWLALEFARRACDDFENVVWLWCAGLTPAALNAAVKEAREAAGGRRWLIVLDGVENAAPLGGLAAGRVSLLVTADCESIGPEFPGAHVHLEPAVPDFDLRIRSALVSIDAREREWIETAAVCAPSAFKIESAAGLPGTLVSRGILLEHGNGYHALHECARRIMPAPDAAAIRRAVLALAEAPVELQAVPGCWRAFQLAAQQPGPGVWYHACTIAIRVTGLLRALNRTAERLEWLSALSDARFPPAPGCAPMPTDQLELF